MCISNRKILKFSYPNNIKSKLYNVCNSLHTCQERTTFMLLSTTFNNISVITYNGGQFYWWRTPRKPCPVASHWHTSGADPGFKVRGAYLKKMRRAEGGAKMFRVFRVKNHDFTPKNHIFSNFRGGPRRVRPPPPPPPLDPPLHFIT